MTFTDLKNKLFKSKAVSEIPASEEIESKPELDKDHSTDIPEFNVIPGSIKWNEEYYSYPVLPDLKLAWNDITDEHLVDFSDIPKDYYTPIYGRYGKYRDYYGSKLEKSFEGITFDEATTAFKDFLSIDYEKLASTIENSNAPEPLPFDFFE